MIKIENSLYTKETEQKLKYDYDALHINGIYEVYRMHEATELDGTEAIMAELISSTGQKRKVSTSLIMPSVENVTTALASIPVAAHSDITSAGNLIEDAVSLRHIQGTDTTLGTMTDNIDMNWNRINNIGRLSLNNWSAGYGNFVIDYNDNLGSNVVTVINEPHAQTTIHTIPDSGTSSTTFVLNRTDNSIFFESALSPVPIVLTVNDSGTIIFDNDPLIINAIHTDVAGEIVTITEKLTLASLDQFVIEDSEDTNNKKRISGEHIANSFNMDMFAEGVTYKKYSASEQTKLAGIEPLADVTDVDNVTTAENSINVNAHQDLSSSGADIDSAVSLKHTQGSDTTLGTMTVDIDMGTNKITNTVAGIADTDGVSVGQLNAYDDQVFHKSIDDEIHSLAYSTQHLGNVVVTEGFTSGFSKGKMRLIDIIGTAGLINSLPEVSGVLGGGEKLYVEEDSTYPKKTYVKNLLLANYYTTSSLSLTGSQYIQWFPTISSYGDKRTYHFYHKVKDTTLTIPIQMYEIEISLTYDIFKDSAGPYPDIRVKNLSGSDSPLFESIYVISTGVNNCTVFFYYPETTNLEFGFYNINDALNFPTADSISYQSTTPSNIVDIIRTPYNNREVRSNQFKSMFVQVANPNNVITGDRYVIEESTNTVYFNFFLPEDYNEISTYRSETGLWAICSPDSGSATTGQTVTTKITWDDGEGTLLNTNSLTLSSVAYDMTGMTDRLFKISFGNIGNSIRTIQKNPISFGAYIDHISVDGTIRYMGLQMVYR